VTDILLRPGDALRIEHDDGSVMTVLAPPGAELWEIRLGGRRDSWWKRWLRRWFRARREERDARQLALFDERLLNDIGLGPNAENPLATRAHNYRQQELRRISMARLGLM
jgi:hypothetical protein